MKTAKQILEGGLDNPKFSLPGPVASWLDTKDKKAVVAEDRNHFKIKFKGDLTGSDLASLARFIDGVKADGGKLIIFIRK